MTATATSAAPSRSGNPAFNERVTAEYLSRRTVQEPAMTRGGVVAEDIGSGYGNVTITIPGGFWLAVVLACVAAVFCALDPRRAALLGIVFAALEGYSLGAISAMFDAQTNGIVGAAILSTVCVFVVSWLIYALDIIKPTEKLAHGVSAAAGGGLLFLLFLAVASLFGWDWSYSDGFQTIGVIVLIAALVLAALGLTLDFGSIDAAIEAGAPKYMEWYCAYGLMWTLTYLYLLILHLLWDLGRDR